MQDISRVQKKLREAQFHLRRLLERCSVVAGDPEEIDFLLSAFLSAGRSVDYCLRHEFGDPYCVFYRAWEASLQSNEAAFMKFMADDRAREVHRDGSMRVESHERIPIHGRYRDASGTITVSAPPGTPPSVVLRPTREYMIDGSNEEATVVCRRYVDLLRKLIDDWVTHAASATP